MIRALAAGAALVLLASTASARPERPCRDEIGTSRAAALARQCRDISPATRPPCNAENACELIRSEIRRGCNLAAGNAPPFCELFSDGDPDGEDE